MLRLRTALFLAVVAFGSAAVVAVSPVPSAEVTEATGAKLVVEAVAWDCPEESSLA